MTKVELSTNLEGSAEGWWKGDKDSGFSAILELASWVCPLCQTHLPWLEFNILARRTRLVQVLGVKDNVERARQKSHKQESKKRQ